MFCDYVIFGKPHCNLDIRYLSYSADCLLHNIGLFGAFFHLDAKLGSQLSICTETFTN